MEDKVHDLGRGCYCYCQDCNRGTGWGWSNSGLIVDGDQALMIDTLRDEKMTYAMLQAYQAATGLAARDIGTLVNTHRDGDHTFGNRLMKHARIYATPECAKGMLERPPRMLQEALENRPDGLVGEFILSIFGPPFDFKGIEPALPTDHVPSEQTLWVGDKRVDLIKVGPAHTEGDLIVHVPDDKVVYTGDIVFFTNTPVLWAGPVSNWIAALDRILDMDVETVIPGHGPVTDKHGVRKVREYLTYIEQESRKRFDAGMSVEEAVQDIALGEFDTWGGSERIVVNVSHFYCTFRGEKPRIDRRWAYELMARYADRARGRRAASPPSGPQGCEHA